MSDLMSVDVTVTDNLDTALQSVRDAAAQHAQESAGNMLSDLEAVTPTLTGETRASWEAQPLQEGNAGMETSVGSNRNVARFLRRGTRKMAARPEIQDAIERGLQQFADGMAAAVEEALR